MRRLVMIALLAIGIAGAAGAHEAAKTSRFHADRFTPPDVSLLDQHGAARNFIADVAAGHRIVISFFYASCTTVCPVSNLVMARLGQDVDKIGGKPVRLVSITVDPDRDTPAVLAEMARGMGERPDWVWLTGSPDQVRKLTHALGLSYERPEDHGVMFIVGDVDTGNFSSTSGMPEPKDLLKELKRLREP